MALAQQERRLAALALTQFRSRARTKRLSNCPIHVIFVCHVPALWSMFDSIYRALQDDARFAVTVVTLPYRHSTLADGQYKDEGIDNYLRERSIPTLEGRDRHTGRWLDPLTLDPDYVFFQTPYRLFDESWSVERISIACRVCHIPYATDIFRGGIDETIHPEWFFKHVHLFFKEGELNKELFLDRYPAPPEWLDTGRIKVSGQPKLDFIASGRLFSDAIWKGGDRTRGRRVLWTPRWNTADGVCHFFDYKDFFQQYFGNRPDASFVFRPHPLCLQNFVATGEMSSADQHLMLAAYDASPNMLLDRSGGYHDTFMTSDMIVTDLSSMLLEYFATGKPVIYTHRENQFNPLGERLAAGCYWVRNQQELQSTLDMLMDGDDPMRAQRLDIIKKAFHFPDGGAGAGIGRMLLDDYTEATSIITPNRDKI